MNRTTRSRTVYKAIYDGCEEKGCSKEACLRQAEKGEDMYMKNQFKSPVQLIEDMKKEAQR